MDIRDYMERRKIDKGKRWRVVKFYSIAPQRQQESWPSIASIQSYISSEVLDKSRWRKGKGLRKEKNRHMKSGNWGKVETEKK